MNLEPKTCDDFLYILEELLERYVYLDILKNPPEGESYYHTKVNFFANKPECTDFYNYYGRIKKWLSQAEDGHLQLYLNDYDNFYPEKKYLRESFAISPIQIHISKNGKVYAVPSKFITYFDEKIQAIIQDNKNKPIDFIDNKDPISYIINFNDNFFNLRSKQAQFVNNQYLIELFDFCSYPFQKEHLKDIKIIYSGSEINLIYDYLVLKPKLKEKISVKEFKRHVYNNTGSVNKVKWDEGTNSGELKCKIDEDNQVNVIYQNNFRFAGLSHAENVEIGLNILDTCFKKFDNNNYPIIVIEDFNGGGLKLIADHFTEYLNIRNPNYIYSTMRNNIEVENFVGPYVNYYIKNRTCKFEKYKTVFNKPQTIDYGKGLEGEKIIHPITDIYDNSVINNNKFYKFRKIAKNIRKQNEIIIFTDGFSLSAPSYVIKQTQLRHGAIIVGYGGNPNLKKFDASQSPSSVKQTDNENVDFHENYIENCGFTFSYTIEENFKYYKDIKYPMEFEITNIDERVELYNKYDDSRYQEFIDEAKKIFQKYNEINCNPDNKNIILLSDKCKFSDNITHGGFECGEDGKWSDKCIPSYCDMGYYYDIVQKKCIVDPCYSIYEEEIKIENTKKWRKLRNLFIWIILAIVVIIIIIILFRYYWKKIKSKRNNYSKLDKGWELDDF